MALGDPIDALMAETDALLVAPISLTSEWQTAIDAGGMEDADNGGDPITNPTTQITANTRHPLRRNGRAGSVLVGCLAYDAAATVSAHAKVPMFGRTNGGPWQLLKTLSGDLAATFTAAESDVSDGTLKYTTADREDHCWDTMGCDEFLPGVEVAHAVSSGDASLAQLMLKLI